MKRNRPRDWEPLADPETGKLVGPLPLDRLVVPNHVELQGRDFLFLLEVGKWRLLRPPANLLERFLKARSDTALFRFAQSFGSLSTPNWLAGSPGFRESLDRWRLFQWELDYLLGIAATLREGLDIDGDPFDAYAKRGIANQVTTSGSSGSTLSVARQGADGVMRAEARADRNRFWRTTL
jgi:hypothetical protein